MGLPTCQQRALDVIESTLQRREPRLASMFSMFARLTTNEIPPRTERLDTPPWWALRRRRRLRRPGRPHHESRRTAMMRVSLLVPLAAMVIATAVYLGMSPSRFPCTPAPGHMGPVAVQSHARGCTSVSGFRSIGHNP